MMPGFLIEMILAWVGIKWHLDIHLMGTEHSCKKPEVILRRDNVRARAVKTHTQRITDMAGQAEDGDAASSGVSQVCRIGLINSHSMVVIERGTFSEAISFYQAVTYKLHSILPNHTREPRAWGKEAGFCGTVASFWRGTH